MRDPHIHVEKTPMPGFGHPAMRALITEATGLVPGLPKAVGTACGRRRPIAMTSAVPERVTCLDCRDWARAEFLTWLTSRPPRSLSPGNPAITAFPPLICATRNACTASWPPDSR